MNALQFHLYASYVMPPNGYNRQCDPVPMIKASDQEITQNRLIVLVPTHGNPSKAEIDRFLRDHLFYIRDHEIPFKGIYLSTTVEGEIFLRLISYGPKPIRNVRLAKKRNLPMVQLSDGKHYPKYWGASRKVEEIFSSKNPKAVLVIEDLTNDEFFSWPHQDHKELN